MIAKIFLNKKKKQFNKFFTVNECLHKCNEVHTKKLNEKFALLHCQLATNTVVIKENIAMKNDEFVRLTEKLNDLELRIQRAN